MISFKLKTFLDAFETEIIYIFYEDKSPEKLNGWKKFWKVTSLFKGNLVWIVNWKTH